MQESHKLQLHDVGSMPPTSKLNDLIVKKKFGSFSLVYDKYI